MAAVVNAARARLLAAGAAAMHPAPAVAAAVAARAAARVGVPRHRHAVVHAHQPVAAATKAVVATATTTHNLLVPMPTWARIRATATRVSATQATRQAANPTPCAPVWTAWLAAAAVAVVDIVAIREVVAMAVARVALVAGATGLVGREVIAALLAAENAPGTASLDGAPIHILHAAGRRAPAALARNVVVHAVDFSALPSLPPVDDVYIALGTTMAAAGDQNAFRAIDYSAVLATAQAARRAGATRCGVVSAMGADPQSRIFYSRIKGEMERDLQALGFSTLVIARPSVLAGNRQPLHQTPRRGESLSLALLQWLRPLIPANYRAVAARDVAHALVHAVRHGPSGVQVLSGRALQSG